MSIYADRIARLREKLEEHSLDALLVTRQESRRYLVGHRATDTSPLSSAGWLLISRENAILFTDFIEYEAASQQVKGAEVRKVPSSVRDAAAEALLSYQRIGFEDNHLVFSHYSDLCQKLADSTEMIPAAQLVEQLRVVKDEGEIALIRRAAQLTDAALNAAVAWMRPGVTENQVAWRIECYIRENGGEGMGFVPIVAAGPNSAMPHARSSDRPLREGEPIVIDIGARVDAYGADLTRSFCLGQADDRYLELYNLVGRAQQAALSGIRAGMTGREADALARDILAAAGYGEAFGHSLGHGVGLMVHEAPRMAQTSTDILQEGTVVSVEPGIYLPGWGGIRTEDLVVVRQDGVEVLSQAPKNPVISLRGR